MQKKCVSPAIRSLIKRKFSTLQQPKFISIEKCTYLSIEIVYKVRNIFYRLNYLISKVFYTLSIKFHPSDCDFIDNKTQTIKFSQHLKVYLFRALHIHPYRHHNHLY